MITKYSIKSKLNNKFKAFSLAELLTAILIISVVLSAAIPTITKKNNMVRENIWNWSDYNNSIYAATGTNQSAILGTNRIPTSDWNSILNDEIIDYVDESGWVMKNADGINFSDENKFVIIKKPTKPGEPDFQNSHIAFYNTLSDGFGYSGRLTMDSGNIALGIGSLQNQRPSLGSEKAVGENTAIGHFALLSNRVGIRNTAIGKKALSNNTTGSYNTAVGFGSLFSFQSKLDDVTNDTLPNINSKNTAIGALAQRLNESGTENTAVGYSALGKNTFGNYNTAVGNMALSQISDSSSDSPSFGNTAIGNSACSSINKGDGNICIGYGAGDEMFAFNSSTDPEHPFVNHNYGLYIGVKRTVDNNAVDEPSIITGQSLKDGSFDKELFVNAKRVAFRPFNGSGNIFEFLSFSGADGYTYSSETAPAGRFGVAHFNLRDTGSNATTGNSASNRLSFFAPYENKMMYIHAYDPYANATDASRNNNINFNYALTFNFSDLGSSRINIRGEHPANGSGSPLETYPIVLNDMVEIMPSDTEPAFSLDMDNIHIKNKYFEFHSSDDTAILSLDDHNTNENNHYFLGFSNKSGDGKEAGFYLNSPNHITMETDQLSLNGNDSSFIDIDNNINISSTGIEFNKENSSISLTDNSSDIYINGIYDNKGVKEALNELNEINQAECWTDGDTIQCDNMQTYYTYSDARLKNILGDNTAGLKEINALEVKNFTFKRDKKKTKHVGVIAQQLQKIFPNAVFKTRMGYLKIRTEDIFYAMVNSIKELFKQIQDLTDKYVISDQRIDELEKQNKELKEQNKELKEQRKALEKRLKKLEREAASL